MEQSDLAERIIDAEEKFSTSSITTSYFSSEYFEHPALYRVLFMGSTTKAKKDELLKKLSQGFVHVLEQQSKIMSKPIMPFKEVKHNLLLLNDEDLISDICEDYGVSMIEADFTWNSNAVNYSIDSKKLLLQYAWNQCPNPRELPSAWLEAELSQTEFKGYMYPEKTPNGIDLCVYFYDGPIDEERTSEDLNTLCILRKLGIYVLPLTNSRDENTSCHFAELLTRHKVRCLDLGNLEVGQEPSFFHHRQSTADRISRLQGMECTQSNIPRVAPYQVVAVEQFCGIENKAVFKLLKRTRERQVIRDELKEELSRHKQPAIEKSISDVIHLPTKKSTWKYICAALCLAGGIILAYQPAPVEWEASFHVNPNDLTFTLSTRNQTGHLSWSKALPLVWLNDQYPIPIQRLDNSTGIYQLDSSSLENFTSLVFTINSTNLIENDTVIEKIKYMQPTNPTFLLLNPIKKKITDTLANQSQPAAITSKEEKEIHLKENDGGFLAATWQAIVFLIVNPRNLHKITIT